MLARARVPRPEVQPLEDLADGHSLLDQPAVEHAHERGFGLVDFEPPAGPVAARDVAVAVGRTSADEPAGPRLLQLAAAEALAQQRPLVFGHGPLDLQEKLVAGIVGDGVVEERHRAAGTAELLEDQDLIGVLAREAVRAEHRDDVDLGIADGVSKCVEPWAIEPCAAVALVAEGMLGLKLMAGLLRPGAQGRDLAVDRLLALLPLGGDPSIDGGAHGCSPSRSGGRRRYDKGGGRRDRADRVRRGCARTPRGSSSSAPPHVGGGAWGSTSSVLPERMRRAAAYR